jgi:predicted house-cleaning noncanonical NTP pyrophosphatase (MazG superfamily)
MRGLSWKAPLPQALHRVPQAAQRSRATAKRVLETEKYPGSASCCHEEYLPIIHQNGHQCGVEVMSEDEYIQALKDKLIEAQEVAVVRLEDLIKELADLHKVIDALMVACRIDRQVVLIGQEECRQSRSGSDQQLCLFLTD